VDDNLVVGCGVYKRQGLIAGKMNRVGNARARTAAITV
jgi:hypothetical protein